MPIGEIRHSRRRPLRGEVSISGAKNAVVAILPATILADDVCRIENIPNISDVTYMVRILKQIGARVRVINKHTLEIDTTTVNSFTVPDELTKHMRASYYLIGALLGRDNQARVSMPGGCDLGIRPMDQHIKGFEFLGADVSIENAMVNAHAEKLIGSSVYMDVVSVGATVNIMLAAVKARGLTVIENAAKEHILSTWQIFSIPWAQMCEAQGRTLSKSTVWKSCMAARIQLSPIRLRRALIWWPQAQRKGMC